MDDSPAFLNVACSVTGRRWTAPGADVERLGHAIARAEGVPELIGRVLAARGVPAEGVTGYLAPTLRDLLPDPSELVDMEAAADRLARAVLKSERIAVFGDYDVDGAAATALVLDWLGRLGRSATPYIPDRIGEGYGPNEIAMRKLGGAHDLILCVDCGTQSHGPIAAARAAGADVLVIDHHLPGETLPDAAAIVNPNRVECGSGLGHLCAAGVVFLLLIAANRALRAAGAITRSTEPPLLAALDLVALATVADVVPLVGVNRAFVRQGLKVLSRRSRPGLAALADVSRLTAPPSSRDLGFALGPRINAGGRVGQADLGLRLLLSREPEEAAGLAAELDRLNTDRRALEAQVLEAAAEQIEARDPSAPLVWAAGEGWHPGVVGIVASRLKDRFNRPAIVIGLDGEEGRGSGRSVPGIDLGSAVSRLAQDGLLAKGGGHAMAAGLTVTTAALDRAMAALTQDLAAAGAGDMAPEALFVDALISPAAARIDLVEMLEAAGPFGPSNPAPRLAFAEVIPTGLRTVGQGHLQLRLAGEGGKPLEAIAFRASETGLAAFLDAQAGTRTPVHLAGRLEVDDWGGRRRAKLRVEDAALPT